jgi:hypothetical protein
VPTPAEAAAAAAASSSSSSSSGKHFLLEEKEEIQNYQERSIIWRLRPLFVNTFVMEHATSPAPGDGTAAIAQESASSLRQVVMNSTFTSVNCYGLNRCIIQANAVDGCPILLNCQQVLDVSEDEASELLLDAGACAARVWQCAAVTAALLWAEQVCLVRSCCTMGSIRGGGLRCVFFRFPHHLRKTSQPASLGQSSSNFQRR